MSNFQTFVAVFVDYCGLRLDRIIMMEKVRIRLDTVPVFVGNCSFDSQALA